MSYYNWNKIMQKKPTEELLRIAKEKGKEPADKVNAALSELKNRGFDEAAYSQINEKANVKERAPKLDENAPTLYSEKVIYVFSILFSVLFGGILLAINLKEVDNRKGIAPTIIFSLTYSILSVYILNRINASTTTTLIFALIGATLLNEIFWKKYIGKDIAYHRKSYIKPLIIALIIFVPIIILYIWALNITP